MKKTRKEKIYSTIGRVVTYIAGWVLLSGVLINALVYVVCNCCTTIK